MKRDLIGIYAVILLTGMIFILSCSKDKSGQTPQKEAVPVTTGRVIQKAVPVQIKAIGNVEAYSVVAVKSQVSGELTDVYFREGQDVKKGDLLFTIDPRPFEASLRQAEAALSRDIAQMENAREEERRYAELVRRGYVAQSQYDQVRTSAAAFESVVNVDKALVENARLQLSYCSIHSPTTGRTGNLMSHKGNIIKANADSPMVVINQIQPAYVNFSVPEQYLPDIKKRMKSGSLSVDVFASKDDEKPFRGLLAFVDNTVDTETGTIKLKAAFDNRERTLWPGQFVTAQITLSTIQDAVIVPSYAVQTGQQGQFVYVVKDNIAELRQVTTGITYKDITVVEKGLAPGELVVTDGHMRLTPNAKVEVKNPGQQAGDKQ